MFDSGEQHDAGLDRDQGTANDPDRERRIGEACGLDDNFSRQRRWQIVMVAQGRCARCGRVRDGENKNYCEACRISVNVASRERQRKKLDAKTRYTGAESYKRSGGSEE